MIIIGIDPGTTAGIAVVHDGVLVRAAEVRIGPSLRANLSSIVGGMRPDLVVIERPTKAQVGGDDRYLALGEMTGRLLQVVADMWPAARVLRPWPRKRHREPGWQDVMHAGEVGGAKDASIAVAVRHCAAHGLSTAWLRGPRGGAQENAADALCLALWGVGR